MPCIDKTSGCMFVVLSGLGWGNEHPLDSIKLLFHIVDSSVCCVKFELLTTLSPAETIPIKVYPCTIPKLLRFSIEYTIKIAGLERTNPPNHLIDSSVFIDLLYKGVIL